MRPPHTQIIIFHNEPPFHSCIYYNVIDDEYQKFKLITSSSNPDLSFIFTSELYHKAGNAKKPEPSSTDRAQNAAERMPSPLGTWKCVPSFLKEFDRFDKPEFITLK